MTSNTVSATPDSILTDITVHGVREDAISAFLHGVVSRCVVDLAGGRGILAGQVSDCRSVNTRGGAIQAASVLNSTGKSIGTGAGITSYASEPGQATNSTGEAVSGAGITAYTVTNCSGISTSD